MGILKELRAQPKGPFSLCHNAADEIERLRAELGEIRELLDETDIPPGAIFASDSEVAMRRLINELRRIAALQTEGESDG
ncbi:MAG: hypothetical protein AAGI67_09505 [Pseudomonadota bacterium]